MRKQSTIPRKIPFFSPTFPLYVARHCLNEKPRGQYVMHWHDYFEVEFVIGGHGKHIINDVSHDLTKGWAYLVKPSDRHSILSNPDDSLEMFTVQFESNMLSKDVLDMIVSASSPIIRFFDNDEYEFLYHLLSQMVRHSISMVEESRMLLKMMLSLYCINIARNATLRGLGANAEKYPLLVQKVISYILLNLKGDLTVKNIARSISASPNYIGNQFQIHTGSSISQYVNQLRLERAREFLMQTELSIQEIAYEVGFNSTSYFIHKFHERYGVVPMSLRENR